MKGNLWDNAEDIKPISKRRRTSKKNWASYYFLDLEICLGHYYNYYSIGNRIQRVLYIDTFYCGIVIIINLHSIIYSNPGPDYNSPLHGAGAQWIHRVDHFQSARHNNNDYISLIKHQGTCHDEEYNPPIFFKNLINLYLIKYYERKNLHVFTFSIFYFIFLDEIKVVET